MSTSSPSSTPRNTEENPNTGNTGIIIGVLCSLVIVGVVCVVIIWRSWRVQRNHREAWRQSKIDMNYAVTFSRQVGRQGQENGQLVTEDTAVVCITQSSQPSTPATPRQRPRQPPPAIPRDSPPATPAEGSRENSLDRGQKVELGLYGYGDHQEAMTDDRGCDIADDVDQVFDEERPKPIAVTDFAEHVRKMKEDSLSFDDEWAKLFNYREMPQTAAVMERNFKKNRYKNILPYDHARVVLDAIEGVPNSDYINASYIQCFLEENTYIASQGPNIISLDDFWRMVWQEKIETIVMATNLVEKGKIKCEKYWPDCGEDITFHDVIVSCQSEINELHGVKKKLRIRKGSEYRLIDHFHFTDWPDKGVPRNASVLLRFIEQVKRSRDGKQGPLLVHCSAGVGRTGVVICLWNEIGRGQQTGYVDIFNFIRSMRMCRPQMVQTPEQYEFIHDAILEFLLEVDTLIPRDQLVERMATLNRVDPAASDITGLQKEFETLCALCHEPPSDAISEGKLAENASKNRYQNILPRDTHRPLLMTMSVDASTQYINATFCHGYRERERIITTQMPLPTTVSDFLGLVYDYRISTIVMLNEVVDEESRSNYWDSNNPYISEPFSVAVLDTLESDHWTERTLELKNRRNTRIIQHFQFLSWTNVDSDSFCRTVLGFLDNVMSQQGGDSPVLVHCLNGVGRTGIFCVAKMCLDQLEVEDAVDIFQIVKTLRRDNHQMIQSLEDYKLCYRIVDHFNKLQEMVTMTDVFDVEQSYPENNDDAASQGMTTNDEEETEEDDDDGDTADLNAYYEHDDDMENESDNDQESKGGDVHSFDVLELDVSDNDNGPDGADYANLEDMTFM